MPHHTPLIATLVAGLVLAFIFGALVQRISDSPAGRLSSCRNRDRPLHPRLRRRPGDRQRARRDRGDPPDVRCRPAFLVQGPALGWADCNPRSRRPDRERDGAGHDLRVLARLGLGSRPRVRSLAIGSEHGGAPAGDAGATFARNRTWSHRRRVAHRRGSRDGAHAGPVAGARAGSRGGSGQQPRFRRAGSTGGDYADQGCGFRCRHADRRKARDSMDSCITWRIPARASCSACRCSQSRSASPSARRCCSTSHSRSALSSRA